MTHLIETSPLNPAMVEKQNKKAITALRKTVRNNKLTHQSPDQLYAALLDCAIEFDFPNPSRVTSGFPFAVKLPPVDNPPTSLALLTKFLKDTLSIDCDDDVALLQKSDDLIALLETLDLQKLTKNRKEKRREAMDFLKGNGSQLGLFTFEFAATKVAVMNKGENKTQLAYAFSPKNGTQSFYRSLRVALRAMPKPKGNKNRPTFNLAIRAIASVPNHTPNTPTGSSVNDASVPQNSLGSNLLTEPRPDDFLSRLQPNSLVSHFHSEDVFGTSYSFWECLRVDEVIKNARGDVVSLRVRRRPNNTCCLYSSGSSIDIRPDFDKPGSSEATIDSLDRISPMPV